MFLSKLKTFRQLDLSPFAGAQKIKGAFPRMPMCENVHPYAQKRASIRKFSRIYMKIFVRPYAPIHTYLRASSRIGMHRCYAFIYKPAVSFLS